MAGQKQSIKVGDLVVCHCDNTAVWYWGKPGLVIYFDHWGKHHTFKGWKGHGKTLLVPMDGDFIRFTRSTEYLHQGMAVILGWSPYIRLVAPVERYIQDFFTKLPLKSKKLGSIVAGNRLKRAFT